MHASGAADACTGRGVSWAVACASAAGRFSGSVGGSPAECPVVAPFRLVHGMGLWGIGCLLLLYKWHKTNLNKLI